MPLTAGRLTVSTSAGTEGVVIGVALALDLFGDTERLPSLLSDTDEAVLFTVESRALLGVDGLSPAGAEVPVTESFPLAGS